MFESISTPEQPGSVHRSTTTPISYYTTGRNITAIVRDGYVAQAHLYVPARERPVSWWTLSEAFEPAARPMIAAGNGWMDATEAEIMQLDGGMFRVVAPAACDPLRWRDWRRQSGVKAKIAVALEESARRAGSRIDLWRAALDLVPSTTWVAVERWNGTRLGSANLPTGILTTQAGGSAP